MGSVFQGSFNPFPAPRGGCRCKGAHLRGTGGACAEDPPFVAGRHLAVVRLFSQSLFPTRLFNRNRLFCISVSLHIPLKRKRPFVLSDGDEPVVLWRRPRLQPRTHGPLGTQLARPSLLGDPCVGVRPGTPGAMPPLPACSAFRRPSTRAQAGAILVNAGVGDDAVEAAPPGLCRSVGVQLRAAVPTEHRGRGRPGYRDG